MIFIVLAILMQVLSIIFCKQAAICMQGFTVINIVKNYYYIGSLASLFLQAIFWQIALKKYPLSYAYVFTSFIYPIILVMSYFIFGEAITLNNIIGSIIIIIGIFFITRNNNDLLLDKSLSQR
jgi:drug/metabolite transporter (DMT)-like permease